MKMQSFDEFKISNQLRSAITDLCYTNPTPIQSQAFPVISSGKDVVGIAQTGTGKTFAYMLPILQTFIFSKEKHPRVLILVPTRELVTQAVEEIKKFSKYLNIKVVGVYGGTNINTQKALLEEAQDIVVGTPGRLYDLILSRALHLKSIKTLVIDEVDVLLDLGFRFQLTNLFDLMPTRRQNIMFSATMTEDIEDIIAKYFKSSTKISVALSGTPLKNITQCSYAVPNFYTKVNLLVHLLKEAKIFKKVLVFVANKRSADRLFAALQDYYNDEICVIHSNKTQNYRMRSIKQFDEGKNRILVTTDVMARGLDLNEITHVINFDTPTFPENYMHRIGRTGRAKKKGETLLFYTEKEIDFKNSIETLMNMEIKQIPLPEGLEVSTKLTPEEQPEVTEPNNPHRQNNRNERGASFQEKAEKNKKSNEGGSYKRIIKAKYKKSQTKGDKNYNKRNKRK